MNKKKKAIKKMALLFACAGISFLAIAVLLFLFKGELTWLSVPRPDIAHVGFAGIGFLYLICAMGLYPITKDKKALIEETDERSKTIEAKSGIIAFAVETTLLLTAMFLLIFTGYMNVVSAASLAAILLISIIVFFTSQSYLRKKL